MPTGVSRALEILSKDQRFVSKEVLMGVVVLRYTSVAHSISSSGASVVRSLRLVLVIWL